MLSGKYLQRKIEPDRPRISGSLVDTVGELREIDKSAIAVGVYFCSSLNQIGYLEDGIVDPIIDPVGRKWRLVSAEYLSWMAGTIEKALADPKTPDADLGLAIQKFYRVRDALEANTQKAGAL